MNKAKKIVLAGIITLSCFTTPLTATDYYVNSETGDDSNDGKSEANAWKTLQKVNDTKDNLQPGDKVMFAYGGLWRGRLETSRKGDYSQKITYSSYDAGIGTAKPRFYGSKSLNRTDDWVKDGNLWRTVEPITDVGDVGNMIFIDENGHHSAGVKCWNKGQLKSTKVNRFWFDTDYKTGTGAAYVWLVSDVNPASKYKEIEAALNGSIIHFWDNVVIENLDIHRNLMQEKRNGRRMNLPKIKKIIIKFFK